ncbi:VOC family protein [Bacillus sp. AK128]
MKMHHIGLYVTDLKQTELFYENMFGFSVEQRISACGEMITFMKKGDTRLELIQAEGIIQHQEFIHLAWSVDCLEHVIDSLATKGMVATEGPYSTENGWKIVFYKGLNQEVIELIEI